MTNQLLNESSMVGLANKSRATKPWRVVFAVKEGLSSEGFLGPYWQRGWEALHQAARDVGVEIKLLPGAKGCNRVAQPSNDCAQWQIRQLIDLIETRQTDGILLAATDSSRIVPAVERAIDADIPIVALDTPVNSDRLLALVTIDNFKSGKAMGEWIVSRLGARDNVLLLTGPQDEQNAIDRRNGVLTGLKTGDVHLLDMQVANWSRQEAKAVTATWLRTYPEIDAIVASNDNMALGAVDAVREAGRKKILITGFDAQRSALMAIQDGRLAATLDQPIDRHARLALQLLIRHLETGEALQPLVLLPETQIITVENVGEYLSN